jgi:hypothetical protein
MLPAIEESLRFLFFFSKKLFRGDGKIYKLKAEQPKAHAAKAAFECACGAPRTMRTAWPGTDTTLDNDQLQTLAAAHLGVSLS